MRAFLRNYGIYLAWLVALVATAGSLYLSEVLHYEPCRLCWFQRIFMYPQVLLLGVAAYRQDRHIIPYSVLLSSVGGVISVYHYAEQKIPALSRWLPCKVGIPCNVDYLGSGWLGFITIPFMALMAAVLIVLFLLAARQKPDEEQIED
ncbi:disulfide oxidoreductase [Paenibacillus sanguinis]|uniref:disulfide oxidoreductase n=1 Tax=Paenibacillus sanguinis TaxID=225906 RepID=UPI00035CFE9F|nr:disulfide oxidoreductase [Paenibacillus sanguinis]